MAYTAIEKMRKYNKSLYGENLGPEQPAKTYHLKDYGVKALALQFLHDRCEGLRHSPELEQKEQDEKKYLGTSLQEGQIPYNMQMDINRLCLERELEKFIDSGVAEDAYTVYYCYLEMFFGHYGKSKKMVELLSEFESNGSSLLMKHRDHYSHSVYVFALGLAFYEANAGFRSCFKKFYGFEDSANPVQEEHQAACSFLEYWGLTALFHDIGYPFELPFEQVLSYFEVAGNKRGRDTLYLSYQNVDSLIQMNPEAVSLFSGLYQKPVRTTEELFACGICKRLGEFYGFTEDYILGRVHDKPIAPDVFGYFMDHAYFSAARLYHELEQSLQPVQMNEKHIDALTAILMHNSLFKFAISFYKDKEKRKKPLPMELHPLAFLLMLCDELQCWDRTAYGRNSRTELHPMAAEFDFRYNQIRAVYYYDREEQEKIDEFQKAYREWEAGGEKDEIPRLKAYSDMAEKEQRFRRDIEKIVDLSHIPMTVIPDICEADRKGKHTYLSTSNFLHLYDFAVALNARYTYQGKEEHADTRELEQEFEQLSLEYQLSNINQAKSFAKYLDVLGCFYTDRPVNYAMITAFTRKQTNTFAPLEHERWMKEHISMGWTHGDLYDTVPLERKLVMQYGSEQKARKALREQFRMHQLVLAGNPESDEILDHYLSLPETEKEKDYKPFNSMLKLIRKFDGLRIYQL